MWITDNSELHKIMVLDHVRYVDHDSEMSFVEHMKLSPLTLAGTGHFASFHGTSWYDRFLDFSFTFIWNVAPNF